MGSRVWLSTVERDAGDQEGRERLTKGCPTSSAGREQEEEREPGADTICQVPSKRSG